MRAPAALAAAALGRGAAAGTLGTLTEHGTAGCGQGAPADATCTAFSVSCPGVDDITGQYYVAAPGAPAPGPPGPAPPSPGPRPAPPAACQQAMHDACPGQRGGGSACRECLKEHYPDLKAVCPANEGEQGWYCNTATPAPALRSNAAAVNATFAMMMGGGMTHYGGTGNQFDAAPLRAAGAQVVGVYFDSDWEVTPFANPEPIKAAACRPATALRHFFDAVHPAGRAFGAFGHSGGSAALSYALSHYAAAEYIDYALVSAGPVFGRVDLGCESDSPAKAVPTSGCPALPVVYGNGKSAALDKWTGAPNATCDTPAAGARSAAAARLAAGSVVSPGAEYRFASTFVEFFYCVHTNTCSNGQGAYYVEKVVAAQDPSLVEVSCVDDACRGEAAYSVSAGYQRMIDHTLARLVPRHGAVV